VLLRRCVTILAIHVVGASAAAAQPPSAAAPPSEETRSAKPWALEVAAGIGKEVGELHGIDRSPLLRVGFGHQIKPYLEVRALARYVDLGSYSEYDGSDLQMTEFDVGFGARLSTAATRRLRLFADLEVFHHTSREVYSDDATSSSDTYYDSGFGLGMRAGALVSLGSRVSVLGGFGVHRANLGGEPEDLIIGWATAEGGLVFHF
jgi:hypothetical protein